MQRNEEHDSSQLFLVRLWIDGEKGPHGMGGGGGPASDAMALVHGKVQHVFSGKAAHFSNWFDLTDALNKMASSPQHTRQGEPPTDKEGE